MARGLRRRGQGYIFLAALATIASAALAQTAPPLGYSIKTIGLTGPGYEYNNGIGIVRGSTGIGFGQPYVTSAGWVSGGTSRYNGSGVSLGRDAWLFNGTTNSVIGLTAPPYSYTAAGGTYRDSTSTNMNDAGQVAGLNQRFSSGGASLGYDIWRYSGGVTSAVNPSGTGYEYTDAAGTHRNSDGGGIDAAGRVIGLAYRFAADGSDLGTDMWRYDGITTTAIGLLGAGYEYSTAGGTFRRTSGGGDSSGRAIGLSSLIAADGTGLGADAWRFNGTTTQRINLTGGVYEYSDGGNVYREGTAEMLAANGHVSGTSYRFESNGNDLGRDTWLYNGTTTTVISLTGSPWEYGSASKRYRDGQGTRINPTGQVLGYSLRFASNGNDLGQDMWVYNGTTTSVANLTGTGYEYSSGGVHRYADATLLSSSGGAAGTSTRFKSDGTELGFDTWLYNGTTSQRVNLTGGSYEWTDADGTHRDSFPARISSGNKVSGQSYRFNASGAELGADAWFFDGTTTKRVNLTGAAYEFSDAAGVHRHGGVEGMNDLGKLIGVSQRYSASGDDLGQAGWFYDPATDLTTALEFAFNNAGMCQTSPEFLTDAGVVLGSYDAYVSENWPGPRVFWWSIDAGFHDLGAMVPGGASAAGWQRLADMFTSEGTVAGGSPKYILGTGLANGETLTFNFPFGGLTEPRTAFLMTAQIPEPGSIGLIAIGLLGLRRRRA